MNSVIQEHKVLKDKDKVIKEDKVLQDKVSYRRTRFYYLPTGSTSLSTRNPGGKAPKS